MQRVPSTGQMPLLHRKSQEPPYYPVERQEAFNLVLLTFSAVCAHLVLNECSDRNVWPKMFTSAFLEIYFKIKMTNISNVEEWVK